MSTNVDLIGAIEIRLGGRLGERFVGADIGRDHNLESLLEVFRVRIGPPPLAFFPLNFQQHDRLQRSPLYPIGKIELS